ncbi:MAG TPA: hypothetical protein VK669_08765 [Candidatus Limnocylindrales bacterium]|nr:hypothetical protein [Candidatus Limnocylindrales bacterium]
MALVLILAASGAAAVAAPERERSNTGPSPEAAARNYLLPGKSFRIVGTKVAGRFAVVRFTGALIESETNWSDDLLVERFPFGWQVVDTVRNACLRERGATPAELAKLHVEYMPVRATVQCSEVIDHGRVADVAAVRSMYRAQSLVPTVRVSDDYALLRWWLPGGGERLYARRGTGWKLLTGGGGALMTRDLRGYGVPVANACTLVPPYTADDRAMCRSAAHATPAR